MKPLPTQDMRSNLGTWAVPIPRLPAVANFMHDAAPNEVYDPHFLGQRLETTYFDTKDFDLRKARNTKDRYMTLRLRCYDNDHGAYYAISAKTESEKWRQEVTSGTAHGLLKGELDLPSQLPGHLRARLPELGADDALRPVICVYCRRYAVEDDIQRFTLDTDVKTDAGKTLPCAVLEFKSTVKDDPAPAMLESIRLYPIKLSKYLWSTRM